MIKNFSKKYIFIVVLILLFPVFSFAVESFPVMPMAFWGVVFINGNPAPVGTVVRAYYGSVIAGTAVVQESGVYGYTESTKQKLVIGEGTSVIIFKIQSSTFNGGSETVGDTTLTYVGFTSGLTVQKDLAFNITVPDTTVPPAPSSGGGGGGGGGSYTPPPATPAITKAGDANGDNKVDKYDFALMMSNWSKTGTNVCDFNSDGKVDKYDFALLMSKWGL